MVSLQLAEIHIVEIGFDKWRDCKYTLQLYKGFQIKNERIKFAHEDPPNIIS